MVMHGVVLKPRLAAALSQAGTILATIRTPATLHNSRDVVANSLTSTMRNSTCQAWQHWQSFGHRCAFLIRQRSVQ